MDIDTVDNEGHHFVRVKIAPYAKHEMTVLEAEQKIKELRAAINKARNANRPKQSFGRH